MLEFKSKNSVDRLCSSPCLLHLDDNILQHDHMFLSLSRQFAIESFDSSEKFFERLKLKPRADLVLVDIDLGDEECTGISVVREIREKYPNLIILMHSGKSSAATISESIMAGADDFIAKGDDERQLCNQVRNAYFQSQMKRGLCTELSEKKKNSPSTQRYAGETFEGIARRATKIVNSAVSAVHVAGESGVGKEVVADIFEQNMTKPIIRVNCAAIAPNLLESELFGYKKGAFTGATHDKVGLIERANGGWIFLDEVGELTAEAQSALLRVLSQKRELIPVGGTEARKVNVRVLSASNKNLEKMVEEGKFRQDLWQRLSDIVIKIPPLRERREEIEPLAKLFCARLPNGPYHLSKAALEVLKDLPWSKGNVRELENCLRAMTEYAQDKHLTPLGIPDKSWKRIQETNRQENACGIEVTSEPSASPQSKQGAFLSFQDGYLMKNLQNKLFLQVLRSLRERDGRLSLRGVAKETGLARNTVEVRLKDLIAGQEADFMELKSLFKSSTLFERVEK